MDYQAKYMIVNALTKIVDDAPTRSTTQYMPYSQTNNITKERFDIWINYIFSVMKIICSYVDVNACLSSIQNIIIQPNLNNEYSSQVNSICQIILEFARSILYL